jgi:hypothetical protein
MWRIVWAPNSIPIHVYIQQDATLHSLFVFGNCSTCFGWYFHPSSGAHTSVSTTSGICRTVTAICRYRGRVGTGLSVLCVAYATHSTLNIFRMHGPINVKSLNNTSKWQMGFNPAFKRLTPSRAVTVCTGAISFNLRTRHVIGNPPSARYQFLKTVTRLPSFGPPPPFHFMCARIRSLIIINVIDFKLGQTLIDGQFSRRI